MIEVNKVAFVKTTDEPVFVLELSETAVSVRRPVQTDKGVVHQVETFRPVELQTAEQKLEADMAFTKHSLAVRDRFQAERKKSEAPVEAEGIFLN